MQLSYRNFILSILWLFILSISNLSYVRSENDIDKESFKTTNIKEYIENLTPKKLKEFQASKYYKDWMKKHNYVTKMGTENVWDHAWKRDYLTGYNLRYSKDDIDFCINKPDDAVFTNAAYRKYDIWKGWGKVFSNPEVAFALAKSTINWSTLINSLLFLGPAKIPQYIDNLREENADFNALFKVGTITCGELRKAAKEEGNKDEVPISSHPEIAKLIDDSELLKSPNNLYSSKESNYHSCLFTPLIDHWIKYILNDTYTTGVNNIIMKSTDLLGSDSCKKATMENLEVTFALSSKLGLIFFQKDYKDTTKNMSEMLDIISYNMPLLYNNKQVKKIHEKFEIGSKKFTVNRYGDTLCIDTDRYTANASVGCTFIKEPLTTSIYDSFLNGDTNQPQKKCQKLGSCYRDVVTNSKTRHPLSSVVVYCVKQLLVKTLMNPEVCNIADLNNYTNSTTIKEDSKLYKFQQSMRTYVKTLLVLYVSFFGLKMILEPSGMDNKTIIIAILKIVLVTYFATGATVENVSDSSSLVGMILTLILNFGTTLSSIVMNSGSSGLCDFGSIKYAQGYESLKLWDSLDCRVMTYLGFDNGTQPWYLYFLLIGILIGDISWFTWSLSYPIIFLSLFITVVYIFITSLAVIFILITFAPLFVPMVLFDRTKSYFNSWFNQFVALSLHPVIAFAFLIVLFSVYDATFCGTCLFESMQAPIETANIKREITNFTLITEESRYSKSAFPECSQSLAYIVDDIKNLRGFGYIIDKIFNLDTFLALLSCIIILYLLEQLKEKLEDFVGNLSGAISLGSTNIMDMASSKLKAVATSASTYAASLSKKARKAVKASNEARKKLNSSMQETDIKDKLSALDSKKAELTNISPEASRAVDLQKDISNKNKALSELKSQALQQQINALKEKKEKVSEGLAKGVFEKKDVKKVLGGYDKAMTDLQIKGPLKAANIRELESEIKSAEKELKDLKLTKGDKEISKNITNLNSDREKLEKFAENLATPKAQEYQELAAAQAEDSKRLKGLSSAIKANKVKSEEKSELLKQQTDLIQSMDKNNKEMKKLKKEIKQEPIPKLKDLDSLNYNYKDQDCDKYNNQRIFKKNKTNIDDANLRKKTFGEKLKDGISQDKKKITDIFLGDEKK